MSSSLPQFFLKRMLKNRLNLYSMPLVKYFTFLIFIAAIIVFYSDSSLAQSLKNIDQSIKAGNISNDAEKSAGENNEISVQGEKSHNSISKTDAVNSWNNDGLKKISKSISLNKSKKQTESEAVIQKFIEKYCKNKKKCKTVTKNNNNTNEIQIKIAQAPLKVDESLKSTTISEAAANITPLSEFPDFVAISKDTLEIEGIQDVIDIYNNFEYFFTGDVYEQATKLAIFSSTIKPFFEQHSKYPYICAMMKLYFTEIYTLQIGTPSTFMGYYGTVQALELFTQIIETYSNDSGSKSSLLNKIVEVCYEKRNYMKNKIENIMLPYIANTENNIKLQLVFFQLLKENNYTADSIKNYIEYLRIGNIILDNDFIGFYNEKLYLQIIRDYQELIKCYCCIGKFDEAQKVFEVLIAFQSNEIPSTITKKNYKIDSDGNEKLVNTEVHVCPR